MMCYDQCLEAAQKNQKERCSSQTNLFDALTSEDQPTCNSLDIAIPNAAEFDHGELLAFEKETLGFYITGHPLSRFKNALPVVTDAHSGNLSGRRDREAVTVAGIVSQLREATTKKKEVMAYVTLEDLHGSINAIFFPSAYRSAYNCSMVINLCWSREAWIWVKKASSSLFRRWPPCGAPPNLGAGVPFTSF